MLCKFPSLLRVVSRTCRVVSCLAIGLFVAVAWAAKGGGGGSSVDSDQGCDGPTAVRGWVGGENVSTGGVGFALLWSRWVDEREEVVVVVVVGGLWLAVVTIEMMVGGSRRW